MLTLATPRLLLRPLTRADAPALHAIVGDAETMLWYPRPWTLAEVQDRIEQFIALYPSGVGLLAMTLKETGALIGDCGLTWQEVDGVFEPEIGYHVHRGQQRRGYATEAARAVRDYAFTTLACDHVISMIRPENLPSRRVAEKNGLTLDRTVFWHGYDHCVYRLGKAAV